MHIYQKNEPDLRGIEHHHSMENCTLGPFLQNEIHATSPLCGRFRVSLLFHLKNRLAQRCLSEISLRINEYDLLIKC